MNLMPVLIVLAAFGVEAELEKNAPLPAPADTVVVMLRRLPQKSVMPMIEGDAGVDPKMVRPVDPGVDAGIFSGLVRPDSLIVEPRLPKRFRQLPDSLR